MVVLIIVFLLSVGEVISQCPPSSGKTLDVYSNNCFVFVGIYLMHNGDCYPNGSYFFDIIVNNTNTFKCALPNASLVNGQLIAPSGTLSCPGTSSSEHLHCNVSSIAAAFSIFSVPFGNYVIHPSDEGWYKCCLPTNCSDPNTNSITFNIFSKC